jgi:hypothetical protein
MTRSTRPAGALLAVFALAFAGCSREEKAHDDRIYFIRATPDRGPLAGGNQVALSVGPGLALVTSAGVTFDGAAVQVVSVQAGGLAPDGKSALPHTVVVVAPARATTGSVEVAVTDENGLTLTVADVYAYDTNPPPPTPGTTTPGSTPGSTPNTGGGNFQFIAGTDKWYVVTDDLSVCDRCATPTATARRTSSRCCASRPTTRAARASSAGSSTRPRTRS